MFRFRLQRVLDLRERRAREATTALSSAQSHAAQARDEEAGLVAARDTLAARAAPGVAGGAAGGAAAPSARETNAPVESSNVGTLRTLHFLLGRLDERVAAAATRTAAAERVVLQREDALRAAYRDQRALDRLRERQHATWRATVAAAEQQRMDEIALTRFTGSIAPEDPPTDS